MYLSQQTNNLDDFEFSNNINSISQPLGTIEGSGFSNELMKDGESLWQDMNYFSREKFTFTGLEPGPTKAAKNELRAFKLFMTDDIVEGLIQKANSVGESQGLKRRRKKDSPFQKVNLGEFWRWMALIILTGLHGKRSLSDNWSTDPLLRTKIFGDTMTADRFMEIFNCLEFGNEDESNPNQEFDEARDLISKFRVAFQTSYNLKNGISIYKSTILRKGYHLHALSESDTGYVWDIFPEEGATSQFITFPGNTGFLKSGLAAMSMLNPLLQRGHLVSFDESYTDLVLFRKLVEFKTDCIGTVSSNFRFLPKSVNKKRWKKTDKRQAIFKYYSKFCFMNFLDHKEFQILSSVGSPSPLEPTGKPEMLSIFTTGMVGHEVVHKLSVEKTSRSQIRSFFKKLFLHILDTSLINAYTISKHTPDMKKNDFHHFLMSLIKGIFLKYTYPPPQPTASSDPDWIRLNGRHIKFDKYEKPRRCHVCSKAGLRRSVMRGCALCKVPLCLEECFELFHTVEDYAKAKQKKSGGRTRTI